MTDLILKKGKERSLLRRHPWVYDTAVQKLNGKAKSGDTVRVVSHDGRFWLGPPTPKTQRSEPAAGHLMSRTKLMSHGLRQRFKKPLRLESRFLPEPLL